MMEKKLTDFSPGKSARECPLKPKQLDPLSQNKADPFRRNNIDPIQTVSFVVLKFDFKKGKATSCFAKVKAKWNTLWVALTYLLSRGYWWPILNSIIQCKSNYGYVGY